MKKKVISKVVVTMLLAACLLASFVISSSAAAVTGRFYNLDAQYISGVRVGYSEANFTGNYFSEGSSSNNAIIYAETKGGDIGSYTSILLVQFDGKTLYSENSNSLGNSLLTYQMVKPSSSINNNSSKGYTEHRCTSKTNAASYWQANYLYKWVGDMAGWEK